MLLSSEATLGGDEKPCASPVAVAFNSPRVLNSAFFFCSFVCIGRKKEGKKKALRLRAVGQMSGRTAHTVDLLGMSEEKLTALLRERASSPWRVGYL